jgi:hypothetical protein
MGLKDKLKHFIRDDKEQRPAGMLTQDEVLDKYPTLVNIYHYSKIDLAHLLRLGLISGYRARASGGEYKPVLLDESSVDRFVGFLNEITKLREIVPAKVG